MRLSINDEIIEIAKKHSNTNERVEIYGKALIYYIEGMLVDERMEEYLNPNLRRSKNMKDKKNRAGRTKNKTGQDLNLRPAKSKKIRPDNTKNSKSKPTKKQVTDDDLTIYITNNNRLYLIVSKYIETNKEYGSIAYQINKQGKERYIYSQMKESEKLVKEIGFKDFEDLLNYISKDDFRCKNILSIAKLNRKNKDGVPYYLVIKDKMKPHTIKDQERERQAELHRQKIREQIESFNSQPKQNADTENQTGGYNWRENISLS